MFCAKWKKYFNFKTLERQDTSDKFDFDFLRKCAAWIVFSWKSCLLSQAEITSGLGDLRTTKLRYNREIFLESVRRKGKPSDTLSK